MRIGAMIAGFTLVAGVPLFFGFSSRTRPSPGRWTASVSQPDDRVNRSTNDPADATANVLAVNPITHYFGIPLSGRTIGYIVDGDATMAPYIDDVAVLTNSVNESIEKGTRRFGVILAVARDGVTFVEAAEPTTELEGARSILTGRLASGRTDLTKALSVASNWYADEVFLVLSKPVDSRQMEVLKQGAEQTGAVVHVIGLGGAAEQDLSPIAKATGGTYVSVPDETLRKLVERQNDAKARA